MVKGWREVWNEAVKIWGEREKSSEERERQRERACTPGGGADQESRRDGGKDLSKAMEEANRAVQVVKDRGGWTSSSGRRGPIMAAAQGVRVVQERRGIGDGADEPG